MNIRSTVPVVLLTFSLLITGGTMASYAHQDSGDTATKPALATVGSVDMQQVYESSDAPALVAQKVDSLERIMLDQLTRINGVSYLDQKELPEYLKILTAPAPTPVEQARAQELIKLSDSRSRELQTLSVKKDSDLTAADRQRIGELSDLNRQFQSVLPNIRDSLQADQQAVLDAFRREQMRRLHGIVGKTAVARGIANVYNSDCLIYSANDLTAEVIRKLKH